MEQKKIQGMKLFWIFLIGSVIGYSVEMLVAFIQKGHWESRQGLLYGPFSQVYGIGMVLYYLLLPYMHNHKGNIFLSSMLLGGIIEYLCSYFQEKWYGTVSWDYSQLWWNIQGRTSLLHCLYWGIGGLVFTQWILPLLEKQTIWLQKKPMQVLTMVLVVFMVVDIGISTMAATRQKERMQAIPAQNAMDRFLDTHYPDEKMDKVYANKKVQYAN